MAKKRRRRRSTSKRAVARHNPPTGARRRRRRSFRHNAAGISLAPRNAVGAFVQGAVDGTEIVAAQAVVRLVRGKLGFEAGTTTGTAVELATTFAVAMVAGKVNRNAGKMALAGGFAGVISGVVKRLDIPHVSAALGDEGNLPLMSGDLGSYELPAGSYAGGMGAYDADLGSLEGLEGEE